MYRTASPKMLLLALGALALTACVAESTDEVELTPELGTVTAEISAGPYATVVDPVCAAAIGDSWTRVMMTPGSPGLLNVSFNGVPVTQLSRLRLNSPPRWGAGTWTVYSTATRTTVTVPVKQDLSCLP